MNFGLSCPPEVRHVLDELIGAGYEAVLVGGCVRDLLLSRSVHDWDVATSATPNDVQRLFPHTVPTGVKHGTVTVQSSGRPVEVTTFRTEGAYSDSRHPDSVSYTTLLIEDLRRRDFTVNAMALTRRGDLCDPFGGQQDLMHRVIRAVGRPHDRFSEDALRILRGLRLAAELNFQLWPDTLTAMKETSPGLRQIAGERIGQELKRLYQAWHGDTMAVLASGPWLGCCPSPWDAAGEPLMEIAARLAAPPVQTTRCLAVFALVAWRAGWAELQVHRAARVFAWPKQMARNAQGIQCVLTDDPLHWSRSDWQYRLFELGRETVEQGCVLLDAWHGQPGVREAPFRDACVRQPLWSSRDLAVAGTDLLHLGLAGPQIGTSLRQLIADVLSDRIENHRGKLLHHVLQRQHSQGGACDDRTNDDAGH